MSLAFPHNSFDGMLNFLLEDTNPKQNEDAQYRKNCLEELYKNVLIILLT